MKSAHRQVPQGLNPEELAAAAKPKKSSVVIYGDEIVFQGLNEAEIDTSHGSGIPLPFGEDAPERYRLAILAKYGDRGPAAWGRLQAASREMLQRLPENPFVQQQAWLCGLHKDGGPHVALMRDRQRKELEEESRNRRMSTAVPAWFIQAQPGR